MSRSRWERLAPLTGVVFFVLIAVTLALSNDTPDTNSSTADTVSYWSAHDSRLIVSAITGTFAVIFLVWFAGVLRSVLLRAEGGEGRLSLVAFAGLLTIGIGGAIASALQFTAADTVNDVPATVTQTLSVLSEDFFFPFLAGIALSMFGAGVCVIRHGGLPKWLGWAAIVIGVVSVTPVGFIGFVAVFLWVLVASVVLYLQGGESPAATTPAA
ncbi:MAG: hypothetical protein ACRDMH_05995 [Solirubrobacterales bacterium]